MVTIRRVMMRLIAHHGSSILWKLIIDWFYYLFSVVEAANQEVMNGTETTLMCVVKNTSKAMVVAWVGIPESDYSTIAG